MPHTPSFLAPLLRDPFGAYALVNVGTGHQLATRLEMPLDSEGRRRGLLGRTAIDPRAALILAPCEGVHTFFMRFPIDIVSVTRAGQVLKVRSAVPAWRIAFSFRAFATVELAAGVAAASRTAPGDSLAVVPISLT